MTMLYMAIAGLSGIVAIGAVSCVNYNRLWRKLMAAERERDDLADMRRGYKAITRRFENEEEKQ